MLPKNFRPVLSLILILMLGTLYLPAIGLAQGDTWVTKSNMPTPRFSCSACEVNGIIYVIGGTNDTNFNTLIALPTVEAYDPATDTWSKKSDMLTPRLDFSICVLNGKIYAIGGLVNNYTTFLTVVEEYDPTTDTWATKKPLPVVRVGLAAVAVNGKIYAIGGKEDSKVMRATVIQYDPATDDWTDKTPMSIARNDMTACVVNGKIYVIGGAKAFGSVLSFVEEYDPITDTWTRKADIPTARHFLGSSVINGMIYAIGGASTNYSEYRPLKSVEEYDPETDTWLIRTDMPTPRMGCTAATLNGKIYAFGGVRGANLSGLVAAVEEYTPPVEAPYISYHSYHVDDSEANNNASPDPGESVKLIIELRNIRFDGVNVSATLKCHDPLIQITQATSNFSNIERNGTNNNQTNPFMLYITPLCQLHLSKFYLDITADGGYAGVDSFQMVVGTPDFLLVDDDCGANYENYYLKCLPLAIWSFSLKGCPPLSVAQSYKAMIWFTGCDRENTLTSDEQAFLASYLDNGGSLFLTGQDIGYDLIQKGSASDSSFYANYLHAELVSDSASATVVLGLSGDPLTNGVFVRFDGDYGAGNQTAPDVINPIAPAEKILNYYQPGFPAAALRYEDPIKNYRLVYFAFGLEGIGGPNEDSAEHLMTDVLNWLQGSTAVRKVSDSRLPEEFVLEQNYPNPFNPTTTINYFIAKNSHGKLTVYNTLGQVVAVLVDGYQAKGSYCVKWEAKNQPSGIYLYKLESDGFSAARKMFLQK